jgi:hypothetical protein
MARETPPYSTTAKLNFVFGELESREPATEANRGTKADDGPYPLSTLLNLPYPTEE